MNAKMMDVDAAAFNLALKSYLAKTSKTMEETVNWKANDLLLTAAKHTPKTSLRADFYKAMMQSPRLVSYRTGRRFGDKTGKGWNRNQWDIVQRAMAGRDLGKGFMRSAFVKGAMKIPLTLKGRKLRGDALEASKLTKSKADVRLVSGQIKGVFAHLFWTALSETDAALKQRIVDNGLAKALPEVTASMIAYLRGENAKNARSVSS